MSASFAAPLADAALDADDAVRNAWSAKRGTVADADDVVRNAWSAKKGKRDADADDVVRNAWSA